MRWKEMCRENLPASLSMRNAAGVLHDIVLGTPSLLHENAGEFDHVVYGLCTRLVELPIRTCLHIKPAG